MAVVSIVFKDCFSYNGNSTVLNTKIFEFLFVFKIYMHLTTFTFYFIQQGILDVYFKSYGRNISNKNMSLQNIMWLTKSNCVYTSRILSENKISSLFFYIFVKSGNISLPNKSTNWLIDYTNWQNLYIVNYHNWTIYYHNYKMNAI